MNLTQQPRNRLNLKRWALVAGLAIAASFGVTGQVQARDLHWNASVALPGVTVGFGSAPVHHAPPRPVYYAPPRPVYYAPPPPHHHHAPPPHRYGEGGYRYDDHHDHHDHRDPHRNGYRIR